MTSDSAGPERTTLAAGLAVSRIVTGLWQLADQERDGRILDLDAAAQALAGYARAGFDAFDMADHYGSAEVVAGRAVELLAGRGQPRPVVMTKWVPEPGPMTPELVRDGVRRALDRLGLERVDLMQLHWWQFEHPDYLDAMVELMRLRQEGLIGHLGVTNFDTAHLRILVKHGIEVAANQVCFSLLDRRAAGAMSSFCLEHGVRLLAFGTLAGGFLSERWLGAAEPGSVSDWSKMKYRRFIEAAGGWGVFQELLGKLTAIAARHGVSIANVAMRWVLDHPAVAAVIVGARLGEREHRADNLRVFDFALDDADRGSLDAVLARLAPIPGDCGDEYRRPPFLTASGDLSHHLAALPQVFKAMPVPGRPERRRVGTGTATETVCGYSRAVRIGERILVSGTTATHGSDQLVCPGDVEGQTTWILDRITAALRALGAGIDDVVRTRIYLRDGSRWAEAARAHGRVFGDALPANTLIEVRGLIGGYEVEIEAEAIVGPG